MSNCVHIDTWPRDDSLAGFFMAVPFWEKHPEIPSGPGGTATLNFSSHRDDPLAEVADRLYPAEDLFDALSYALTDGVAGVPSRPLVDARAFDLLRDVRRH